MGCSGFVNQLESNILNQKRELFFGNKKDVYCKENVKLELINSNESSQDFFASFIQDKSERYQFKFIDKAVLWSLYQLNLRPDISTPTSKLQVFLKLNGTDEYFHFFSKAEDTFPNFFGLESLLKKYNSKYTLYTLAKIADAQFKSHYKVSKQFEDFLYTNREKIREIPIFRKYFFRGDETLRENENISAYPLTKIYQLYQKKKRAKEYQISQKLFAYDKTKRFKSYCNYDMNMYSNSIYLIHKTFIKSNLFGIKEGTNFMLVSTSQDLGEINSLNSTPFFKGRSQSRSAAFCKFDFNSKQNIWMTSTESRDPGQHLYHLIEYGIEKVKSIEDLDQIMRFSRHLFLENPHRLIIESKRSSQEQLDRILKIDIPIYNANQLGKVWGYYSTRGQHKFIIDDRGKGVISCK